MSTIIKYATSTNPPRAVGPRTYRFTASTAEVDRDKDVIRDDAWDLSNWLKNPVILAAHDYGSLPVARGVRVTLSPLVVDVEFPPEGTSKASDEAHALVAAGYVRAVSVGFRPLEGGHKYNEARGGYDFTRVELLEVSLCAVPAQPNALLAARYGGKAASAEPRYAVDAGMLARAINDAIRGQVRKHLAYLSGRLGDDLSDAAVDAMLKGLKARGANVSGLVRLLGGTWEEPARRELAEHPLKTVGRAMRDARPTKQPEPVVIPAKYLRAAAE